MRDKGYDILKSVLYDKKHAHVLLRELELSKREHAFVSRIVYGVLQNKIYLEYHISTYTKKKPDKKSEIVLLMGAYEGLFMDSIPDYAVVNEYVNLGKKLGLKHQTGFINVVIKKILQGGLLEVNKEKLEKVSIETSVPIWILKLLKAQYSESFAIDYAYYSREIKPIYGWVNRLKFDPSAKSYLNDGVVNRDVFRTSLIKDAHLIIQDINSQSVVDLMQIEKGMRVLDCCCAPGTKTLRIANRLENSGEVVGIDIAPTRIKLTQDLMKRAGVENAEIMQADATDVVFNNLFDAILIDAPCSGLGVIAHKHDLRYNIEPNDLDNLQMLQRDILKNITQYIKIDGIVTYSTCTLNKKENEKQIADFLSLHSNFELIYEETMNPVETRGDGFYVAQLRRKW